MPWGPKVLSLKSFGNFWGSLYIPCLVLIITIRFTCGDTKILSNIKMSQNIMTRIAVCEISFKKKKIFIVTLYRCPSQSFHEFDEFLRGFEDATDYINQCNPYFTLITGDFNALCNRWWENDSNNTEGVSIDNLTSSYGLKQLIAEPNHILSTSSSCIDLLFTNQSNMVVNSGVFPSIHQSCNHVFAKVNLKSFIHNLTIGVFGTIATLIMKP